MPFFNKNIASILSFAIISPYFLVGGGQFVALAACVDGAQCVVTDGNPIVQNGGHFISGNAPAFEVSGAGSQITGIGMTIDNGTNPLADAYFDPVIGIKAGGAVELNSNSTIKAYQGIYVEGTDSRFAMLGGIMTIEDAALSAFDDAFIQLDDVTINKDASFSSAYETIFLGQAQFQAHDLTMNITNGQYENALAAYDSQLKLKDSTLDIEGEGMAGLSITLDENSQTDIDNVTMNIKGDYTQAIFVSYNGFDSAHAANFSNMNITLDGDFSQGLLASSFWPSGNWGMFTLSDSTMRLSGKAAAAIIANVNHDFLLDRLQINITGNPQPFELEAVAINAGGQSNILLRDSSIKVTKGFGAVAYNAATLRLDNSHINASGHDQSHGLVFAPEYGALDMMAPDNLFTRIEVTNGSLIEAEDAAAVMAIDNRQNIVDIKDSQVSGDRLANVAQYSNLTINADNAKLFGGTRIEADDAWLNMNLTGGTTWRLHLDAGGNSNSDVSILSLDNSVIDFTAPTDPLNAVLYQTLHLGEGDLGGETNIYKAGNNARITLNSYLNEGGDLGNQFTDRLLVNGDVSGITTVIIREMAGSPGGETSPSGNNAADEGISLIQVSGQAAENSFQLAGGYVTMNALPYRYQLFAYGPGASNGAASTSQRLVKGSGDYWDFRLQSLARGDLGGGFFDNPTPELVPQAPNYLLTPLGLSQAGLLDISTLHRRLGDFRANLAQNRQKKQAEYFLIGYHGDYHYQSNLMPNQYGYDANLRYSAAQLGGNIYGFENDKGMARFGLSVSRGNLSLDPRHVAEAQATDFGTWNASAYFTYMADNGFYLDSILSYGGFSGDVSSKVRGKTAKMGGHMLQTSLEIGQSFTLGQSFGISGLEIEPQMQLIYQQLDFNAAYDRADNFAVELGRHEQFWLRVGAHLTQKFSNALSHREASIYAKIDYIHAFKKSGKVWLGDDFNIGDFGNHIEAGIGFNAPQSDNGSLYGEATWQQQVGNSGFSGIRLNGGLRVQF